MLNTILSNVCLVHCFPQRRLPAARASWMPRAAVRFGPPKTRRRLSAEFRSNVEERQSELPACHAGEAACLQESWLPRNDICRILNLFSVFLMQLLYLNFGLGTGLFPSANLLSSLIPTARALYRNRRWSTGGSGKLLLRISTSLKNISHRKRNILRWHCWWHFSIYSCVSSTLPRSRMHATTKTNHKYFRPSTLS